MPRPLGLIPDSADVTNDAADPLWLAGLYRLEPAENKVIDLTQFSAEGNENSLQSLRSKVWQAIVGSEQAGELTINSTTPDVLPTEADIGEVDAIPGVVTGTDVVALRPGQPGYHVDPKGPQIVSLAVPAGSAYVDVTFDEGVFAAGTAGPVLAADLEFELITLGGATAVSVVSVKQDDEVTEGAAAALVGGETVLRVFLSIDTGTVDGTEVVGINPAADSISDAAGNPAVTLQKTVDLVEA